MVQRLLTGVSVTTLPRVCVLILVLPVTTLAQETIQTTVADEVPSGWQTFIGSSGSATELCERVAGAPWAVEYRPFGTGVECLLSSEQRPGYRTLRVFSAYGMRLYLLHEARVISLLEDVNWHMTESGDASLIRSGMVTTFAGERAVFFETRAAFANFEAADVVGYTRHSITVCMMHSDECTQVPVRMEFWAGEAPDGGHAAVDGYAVTERSVARAVAVVRRNGALRLSLREGTWRHLYGSDWFNPDASLYPSSGTTQIVRYDRPP